MIFDFERLIIAESQTLESSQSDRTKLSSLGNIYYDYAQHLEQQSQELLDLATQPQADAQEDTIIDESFEEFLESFMIQSVSGNFLDSFLVPRERSPYPQRATTEVQELPKAEAIEFFAQQDLVAETIAIAEPEDIASWSDSLLKVMEIKRNYNFFELVQLSGLSPGQVFLALFLGDYFELSRKSDFYGEIKIRLVYG